MKSLPAVYCPTLVCLALISVGFGGCNPIHRDSLKSTTPKLDQSRTALATGQSKLFQPRLVHLVWLTVRDDTSEADYQSLVGELYKLAAIEGVQDLEVGRFQDLQDPRAMSDRQVVMQMGFASQADYHTYQQHPIHLQLKSDLGPYLDAAPLTYDYWSQAWPDSMQPGDSQN